MKKILLLGLVLLLGETVFGQMVLVSGTVTDEKGNSIPFVFIKDGQHNTATFSDPNGAFTLNADPNSELLASSNNYSESVVKIDNPTNVKIVMKAGGKLSVTPKEPSAAFDVHEIGGTDKSARPLASFGTSQEELHGSPYFFNEWVHGYATSPADSIVENDGFLFNYEKQSGSLLFTDNGKTMRTVDKSKIKTFTLFDQTGQSYTFENVPAIDPKHYLMVLASGTKYKIYKQLGTKFLKADFQTNGITTSGNNYDSYVDESSYYIIKLPAGVPQKIALKKKSIKLAFASDAYKFNTFMNAHDSDEIDDAFLMKLGTFMNN